MNAIRDAYDDQCVLFDGLPTLQGDGLRGGRPFWGIFSAPKGVKVHVILFIFGMRALLQREHSRVRPFEPGQTEDDAVAPNDLDGAAELECQVRLALLPTVGEGD